jgi:hypothetical protein
VVLPGKGLGAGRRHQLPARIPTVGRAPASRIRHRDRVADAVVGDGRRLAQVGRVGDDRRAIANSVVSELGHETDPVANACRQAEGIYFLSKAARLSVMASPVGQES